MRVGARPLFAGEAHPVYADPRSRGKIYHIYILRQFFYSPFPEFAVPRPPRRGERTCAAGGPGLCAGGGGQRSPARPRPRRRMHRPAIKAPGSPAALGSARCSRRPPRAPPATPLPRGAAALPLPRCRAGGRASPCACSGCKKTVSAAGGKESWRCSELPSASPFPLLFGVVEVMCVPLGGGRSSAGMELRG